MQNLWYLEPAALKIIAALKPVRVSHTKHYTLTTDRWGTYEGPQADHLRAIYSDVFAAAMKDAPATLANLVAHNADEVLAAMFGCPNRLEWADADRAAKLDAIRISIETALKVAA